MDYLQDLRDPDTVERLRPYFDMIAKGHAGMWDGINTIAAHPTGWAAKYGTNIDLLRQAIERGLADQKHVGNVMVIVDADAEADAIRAIDDILGLPADRRRDLEDDLN